MAEISAIARPYAEAAFELAREAKQLGTWSDALRAAAETVGHADVAALIDSPGTDLEALVGLIGDISNKAAGNGIDTQVVNLLKLLAENRRLPALPAIAEAFDKLKTDVENRVDVVLTAATPVNAAQQKRIAAALKKRFGRDVNLQFNLDKSLIGGARIQADDLVIDGSVSTGLAKLASTLTH